LFESWSFLGTTAALKQFVEIFRRFRENECRFGVSFFIDVNLSGSWSGIDTRKMAEEAGLRDFYRFTHPNFSSAVHSTWNHVGRWGMVQCESAARLSPHSGHGFPLAIDGVPAACGERRRQNIQTCGLEARVKARSEQHFRSTIRTGNEDNQRSNPARE
jgi:hypothetical protein